MLANPAQVQLADRVAQFLHVEKPVDAARMVLDYCQIPIRIKPGDEPAAYTHLTSYLHDLLDNGGMEEAAKILWSPTQFTCAPGSVKQVWDLIDQADMFLIMGAAKMGKSYSVGVRFFLEWIRDPEFTSIRVLGPSEDHLEANLFSHLVALHKNATIPMPGEIGDLFIGLTRRDQLSAIRGVVIPKSNTKKAGRLQGGHRRPRPHPHPVFGPLSRLYIFMDEVENIASGVWLDVDNVVSDFEKKGEQGMKIGGAYNPTNPYDEVGKRAEPPFGWNAMDPEQHYRWSSIRGWEVLRLDGERSENVVKGEIIYPGLQNRVGLEMIAKNAGGRNAPGYQTMGRGMYPSMGMEATVIPSGMFSKWVGEVIWYEDPISVGATDLALEGDANAVHTLGKWGRAAGVKFPPSLEFPAGRTVMFKNLAGVTLPRWVLQAEKQFVHPKGNTVAMTDSIIQVNRKAGTTGLFYACDRTGHGAGVADLMKDTWSSAIHDINYSQGCSVDKIMREDTQTCDKQFNRMNSELWFALRAWGEFGYLFLHPQMDFTKLTPQITTRRFFQTGGKTNVESKKDYMLRGNASPDEADSLTLLVHAARKGASFIPDRKGSSDISVAGEFDESWNEAQYPGGARIDESNRSDFLDESMKLPTEMGEGGGDW
jgi:hypothetical protein